MDYLKQFRIPFAGLKPGKHLYLFTITKEFLSHFNFPEIDDLFVEADFSLNKEPRALFLNFKLEGKVKTLCDRCGDDLNFPIHSNQELIIKFGPEAREESEKVIIIHSNETEIDISQYIYEFITFAFPLKKLHPEGMCNKKVLKKLKQIKVTSEKKENLDPRWQELKKLKDLLPLEEVKKN